MSEITTARSHALAGGASTNEPDTARLRCVKVWVFLVTVAFAGPLVALIRTAREHELHNYILVVPAVSAFLLYFHRNTRPAEYCTSLAPSAVCVSVAVAAALVAGSIAEPLRPLILAFVAMVAAGGFFFLGSSWMRQSGFAIAFLLFLIPLPDALVTRVETALVQATADVVGPLFSVAGMPYVREDTVYALPTVVLRVAQQCSGIRSTWILIITSVLACHLFLRSGSHRLLLMALVIPLGIVRNALRILVIGWLCVHVGPHMLYSRIHSQGGPVFFALSLIPLFALLILLRRREQRRQLVS